MCRGSHSQKLRQRCTQRCRRGGRYKEARRPMREQGRSETRLASLPHVKLALMSAPGPTGERQGHLDAVVAFGGAGQRRMFRVLAARGDASQTACDRTTSHYRREIQDPRVQGIVYCPLVWTARPMGGHTQLPHQPCHMQQTSQHAEMANKCQQKPYRWKHNCSASAKSNDTSSLTRHMGTVCELGSYREPQTNHWALLLDGCEDEDMDTRIDTTVPDADSVLLKSTNCHL